jgi:uncharacterized protein (DUF2132 family)
MTTTRDEIDTEQPGTTAQGESPLRTLTPPRQALAKDPLHGVTLEAMVRELEGFFGWHELGERIPIRCFQSEPSVSSSLKFLRKTPWARAKVESLFLFMQRERVRRARGDRPR